MLNERQYENDGRVHKAPLITAFCCSNEGPQGSDLGAVHDRMHFKHVISPLKDGASVRALTELVATPREIPTVITIHEVREAHSHVDAVTISDDVHAGIVEIWQRLRAVNITVSDRKLTDCIRVIRAHAFYQGRTTAQVEDLVLLSHMLWEEHSNFATVRKIVNEIASPIENEALALLEDLEAISNEVKEIVALENRATIIRRGKQVLTKLQPINDANKDLRKRAVGTRSAQVQAVGRNIQMVTTHLLRDGFKYQGDTQKIDRATLDRLMTEAPSDE
jgi:MoxR-like ATPase